MAMQVCMGAMLQCSFGAAPSALVVTPENKVLTTTPAATIMDHIPMKNIISFGMCTTQSNPAVAAATAAATSAALGVFTPTPAPCVPATASPWIPGSPTVLIANQPALSDTSTLMCAYGGVITIKSAGQASTEIP
ncbi:MAG TPA: DUF4280 domain-containing protein [Desulfobacterales bacterium]|nr:DUF4280 domain-containing protein [Desulfobacterales bacterium]